MTEGESMKNLEGQRIVMTGATGFIGRNVAEQLLAQGARVFALVRPESRNRRNLPVHEHLTWIEAAMEEAESCVPLIGHADGFLHFAWGGVNRQEIDSPEVQASNVDGSLACLEAACRLGCQVFMDAGSRVEYGITADGTMEESMECHPVNAYGKAKLEFAQKAEAFCRQNQMTFYHLRFFSVYGTGDHPWSIISTLVRELPQNHKVSLSACRHRWNFMDISDAARAVTELYRFSDLHDGECGFRGYKAPEGVCGGNPQDLRGKGKSGVRHLCAGKGRRFVNLSGGPAAEGADRGNLAGAGSL